MRKYLTKTFLLAIFFIATFTGELAAAECASCCTALRETKSPTNVTYNECTGKISFDVRLVASAGFDMVKIDYYNIKYTYTGASGWIDLIKFDNDNATGYTGPIINAPGEIWVKTYYPSSSLSGIFINGTDAGANWAGNTIGFVLPAIVLEKGGFRIRVDRATIGIGAVDDCSNYDGIQTIDLSTNINTFTTPSSFSVTNSTVCNAANLTWVDPGDNISCLTDKIEIQRKLSTSSFWNTIATVNYNIQSYSDPLSNDNGYDYRIRAYHQISGIRRYYSPYSTELQGKRKSVPGQVTGTTASVDNCGGTIAVAWNAAIGADAYNVFWIGGGNAIGVTGNTYAINPVTRGQNYAIDIQPVNNCGVGLTVSVPGGGLSPGDATVATNLNVTQGALGLTVTWVNGNNVENISLVKAVSGLSGSTIIPLTAGIQTYTDTDIDVCKEYTYNIVSDNICNSPANSLPISINVNSDLSGSFSADALICSKGYYANRVELSWTLMNNANLMDGFKVYRKILGASGPTTLLNSLNDPNSNLYLDYLADAGVLYEYAVVGYGNCLGVTLYSDTVKSVGFKSSTGIINGEVSYTLGIAVEGVKVLVETVSPSSGNSLQFNGTNKAENLSPSFDNNSFSSLTVEAWVKLDATPIGSWSAISDCEGIEAIKLGGDAANIFFSVENNSGTIAMASAPISNIIIGEYNHFAGVYGETPGNVKFYLNGNLLAENTAGTVSNVQLTSICLGDGLNGHLEEARFWNIVKDSLEILSYFNIKSNNTEAGLKAIWNFDEAIGNFAYDQSHSGPLYNKNHCEIINSATWNTDIPTSAQLGLASFTNASGDYNIIVPFSGVGENFTVTPTFGNHQFYPGNQVLFIGDGSTVQNNVNFEDISSFLVTGSLYYDSTTCPVEGAYLKIDGQIVVANLTGLPIVTDALGQFEISVPVGEHVVTIEKSGHVFSENRFPLVGTYDFQAPVTGIQFTDATLVKVIGRVVGGLRESTKFPGLGRSINNIGQAQIIFTTQSNCHVDTIYTDIATGEYEVFLLPSKHVVDISIPSNLAIDFGTQDLLDLDFIPPMQTLTDTSSYDSTFMVYTVQTVTYQRLLDFPYREDPKIDILGDNLLGIGLEEFKGDRSIQLVDYSNSADTTFTIPIWPTSPFEYDVFTESHPGEENFQYRAYILAYEKYVNNDNGKIDTVPVSDGKILINNELAAFPSTAIELSSVNTNAEELNYLVYDFEVGSPNFNINANISAFSYTKTMSISIETPFGQIIPWLPMTHPVTGQPDVYRAYLLGSQNFGNEFLTFGPESVDFILRDPPGGESFVTRTVGQSSTVAESWAWNLGLEISNTDKVNLGAKFSIGFGVTTETDIASNLINNTTSKVSGGHSGFLSRTVENLSEWTTNAAPENVGSGSDIFIGHSTNVEFGVTDYLRLVPDSMCAYVDCISFLTGNSGYSMAKPSSLAIVPQGYNTGFIYSQDFIENVKIPELVELRNTILQSSSKYSNVLSIGHANYAKNNDDTDFGLLATIDPTILNIPEDYDGESYTYTPISATDSLIDTVRLINQQISLWEKAIYQNEFEKVNIDNQVVLDSLQDHEETLLEEKYEASNNAFFVLQTAGVASGATTLVTGALSSLAPAPGFAIAQSIGFVATTATNIAATETVAKRIEYLDKLQELQNRFANIAATNHSINGGITFTNSISSERVISENVNLEFGGSVSLGLEIQAKVNNTGVGVESGLAVNFDRSSNFTNDSTVTNSVSYTLSDGDNGDFFSVDVFPSLYGWGPIFKRRAGGKTSCPHEPAEFTKYYNPGTVISEATLQRDLPGISVDLPIITNIPIDQPAIFNLTVSNNTQTGDHMPYVVTSLTQNNPFGAIVRINGSASQTPLITANTDINMTLTVEKGPGAVYDYDSLLVIVHSVCQYDYGVSTIYKDIADSVYVSAHFLPTCTDVELLNPSDNWVLNNSFNDTLSVITSGYNINFFDLERFRVEYKPSSDPNWIGLQSFYKDTTGQPTYLPIPDSISYTNFDWETKDIDDGDYDLRVTSLCSLADVSSLVYSGTMDRINPHNFGTPSPADGILDPNDDISIKFNEPIHLGSITPMNFDVRGVLNETPLRHSTSLYFDGIDDEILILGGANIQNRDFTIEFWAKRDVFGEQVIFSQGNSALENMSIGYDALNRMNFKVGSTELTSSNTIVDNIWHHYAFAYDFDNETLEMYLDGALTNNGNINFFPNFVSNDALVIAKNAATNTNFFNGNIHELRVWNTYRTLSDIVPDMNVSLSPSEIGLLYNWRMDEATGTTVTDFVRQRNGVLNGATWTIEPQGNAISFDGVDDYLEIDNIGNTAISDEMDFTLEFWFNSNATNNSILFSNGTGSGLASDSLTSWNIEKMSTGEIMINHNGMSFEAVSNNYFDGEWHHFAIVFQREVNLSAFIDGNLQNSTQAIPFQQFGSSKMFLGARGYYQGAILQTDSFTTGQFDEFRFWNTARKVEQVARDKQNRLLGDELGLKVYIPFEEYAQVLGVPVLTASLLDAVDTSHIASFQNGASFTGNTPTVKLQRPIQAINFTYSVNGDEIVITPTTSSEIIENVTLDITVSGIKDLQGNYMQSPKTWIAYIDKNQVVWQDDILTFDKDFGTTLSFTTAVINNGGSVKIYDITNLPDWLSASQTTGSISPNSVEQITFTIDPNVNIGDYIQDIHLTTDFGFSEKLTIELKVRTPEPAWTVNPANYSNSMSIVGFIEINDVVSTSAEDILAVFVNDTCRGTGHLEYVPQLDRYLVYLDVYSNLNNGESLDFKVWDASAGTIFSEITPDNLSFVANGLIGNLSTPQLFETSYEIEVAIPLNAGWNWVSHFLLNPDSLDLDKTLESLESVTGDEIKGISNFSNYLDNTGWVGSLNTAGIIPEEGYKLKVSQIDTLLIKGDILDPTTKTINLAQGWTWIGFVSVRNQSVNQALGNLNATDGDIIKAQSQFAIYDNLLGWVGSLQTMKPGTGYMYFTNNATSFVYPAIGQYKFGIVDKNSVYKNKKWTVTQGKYSSNMTIISSLDTDCYYIENNEYIAIGVFDEDANCRAVNLLENLEENQYSFLTVGGKGSAKLKFGIMDTKTGRSYDLDETINFSSNERKGTVSEPFMLKISNEICFKMQLEKVIGEEETEDEIVGGNKLMQVYPTLFENDINVYFFKNDLEEKPGNMKLYNLWGQLVFEQNFTEQKGYNKVSFDVSKKALPIGVYHLVIEDGQSEIHSFKIVKE